MPALQETATALVAPGKGILAADESIATMSKRLDVAGIPPSPTARRDYRQLLLTTYGLSGCISGIILCDETLRQSTTDGTSFGRASRARGIRSGIKVDTGVTPLPFADGGQITEGLDGLRGRLEQYRELGATFAKWRAVFSVVGLHRRTVGANAHALARYAALCQEAGIVPIVEPEVVMDGTHGIATCEAVTSDVLGEVFDESDRMGVDPSGMVLKPNMVLPGIGHDNQSTPPEVARRTLQTLRETVPPTVPGIAFLSGGQTNDRACANLEAINRAADEGGGVPWRLTFSFGRALVNDALQAWRGEPGNVKVAQDVLAANCLRAAAASIPSGRTAETVGA